MGKNTGKVREFCQSGKVGTLFYIKLKWMFLSNINFKLKFSKMNPQFSGGFRLTFC